jgi:solute:Na+ symporter, SSS family
VVDDVYRRFISPHASEDHYVNAGRGVTVGLMVMACIVALWLEDAAQAFHILLQIGAGTGLIFLLRWYWWRINAWGEIAAMVISFLVAVYRILAIRGSASPCRILLLHFWPGCS